MYIYIYKIYICIYIYIYIYIYIICVYIYDICIYIYIIYIIYIYNIRAITSFFPTKGVEDTNKFLLAKLYEYLGNFDQKLMPRRGQLEV